MSRFFRLPAASGRSEPEGTRWQDLLSSAPRACGVEGEAREPGHNEIGKCASFCGQKHRGCCCFIETALPG